MYPWNQQHYCCCCCWVASVVSDSVRPQRQQPPRFPHPWDSPGKDTGVGCHFLLQCMKVKSESEVAQWCPTPRDPMDCSLPGSSVHGIFQARVLEWGAVAFSYQQRNQGNKISIISRNLLEASFLWSLQFNMWSTLLTNLWSAQYIIVNYRNCSVQLISGNN